MNSEDSLPDPPAMPAPPAADKAAEPAPAVTADQDALRREMFQKRLQKLLGLHIEAATGKPNPPMWSAVQFTFFALAFVALYVSNRDLREANADEGVIAVVSIAAFFTTLLAPDLLLKLFRRYERRRCVRNLEETLVTTALTYPEEVEQCGGIGILADRVETQALVEVLENKGKPAGDGAGPK